MNFRLGSHLCLALIVVAASSVVANPVTTVPWNGYKGAVSFTFDDGCASQLTNVVPALQQRGIHATFFVPGFGTSPAWIDVAKSGNEIANHTVSHADLTSLTADSVSKEIVNQATRLRGLDASIKSLTLAYPGCTNNAMVDTIANKTNLIARACGGGSLPWSTQPSWMQTPAIMVQDTPSYKSAMTAIADAAVNKKWLVTLDHGVGGEWLSVAPAMVTSMFDLAITDSLWIDTYLNVAAYWRASFTMDTVHTTSSDSGWTLKWKSPHAMMPTSVPLRIKLDAGTFGTGYTVYQNGKTISAQSNGAYIIDFMTLQLVVKKASVASSSSSVKLSSSSVVSSSSVATSTNSSSSKLLSSSATTSINPAEPMIHGAQWSIQGNRITLQLDYAVHGSVEVLDIFGHQRFLFGESNLAAGEHVFEGASLPSGVYIVRLASQQGISAQKFLLISQ